MKSLKTRLKGLFGLALLLIGITSLSSCILLEYRYPEEFIKPTNTIGFHELWSVEVEEKVSHGEGLLEHTSLLALDLDGDGERELLVTTSEANWLQVVKGGETVGKLHLEVPGEAIFGLSEVVEGTTMAKIVSTGMNISLVDLRTGEVVKTLAEYDGSRLFLEDITGNAEKEVIVSIGTRGEYVTVALDPSGRELWRVPEVIFELKYVGDFDRDGKIELVTSGDPSGWTVIDSKGEVSRIAAQDGNRSKVYFVGDLDGDGEVELAAGAGVYDLKGRKRWRYKLSEGSWVFGTLDKYAVVGDADGDGKKEIAFFSRDPKFGSQASADHWIFLFDAQGKLLWNHKTHASVLYPGAFVDINADSRDELVFFEQLYDQPRVLHVYGSKQ